MTTGSAFKASAEVLDTAEWRDKPSPSEFLIHKLMSITNGHSDAICNKGRVTRTLNFLIRTKWAREWYGIKKYKYKYSNIKQISNQGIMYSTEKYTH